MLYREVLAEAAPKFKPKKVGKKTIELALDSKVFNQAEPKFVAKGTLKGTEGPFTVFEFQDRFYFVENGVKPWRVANDETIFPGIYMYTPKKGNLVYGNATLWARREIKSGSKAFHKDKPERMAIPDDYAGALKAATDHMAKYKPTIKPHGKL